MTIYFTCLGCGKRTADDDSGCLTCDLCADCTPAHGTCLDCRDLRAEDAADLRMRAEREWQVDYHWSGGDDAA